MTKPIKFPARDKALAEIKKIDHGFESIAGSISKVKEFEQKRTRYLAIVALNDVSKQIEKCQAGLEAYKKENYPASA